MTMFVLAACYIDLSGEAWSRLPHEIVTVFAAFEGHLKT